MPPLSGRTRPPGSARARLGARRRNEKTDAGHPGLGPAAGAALEPLPNPVRASSLTPSSPACRRIRKPGPRPPGAPPGTRSLDSNLRPGPPAESSTISSWTDEIDAFLFAAVRTPGGNRADHRVRIKSFPVARSHVCQAGMLTVRSMSSGQGCCGQARADRWFVLCVDHEHHIPAVVHR